MEKRVFLAIFISFLILALYQAYVVPPPIEPEAAADVAAEPAPVEPPAASRVL